MSHFHSDSRQVHVQRRHRGRRLSVLECRLGRPLRTEEGLGPELRLPRVPVRGQCGPAPRVPPRGCPPPCRTERWAPRSDLILAPRAPRGRRGALLPLDLWGWAPPPPSCVNPLHSRGSRPASRDHPHPTPSWRASGSAVAPRERGFPQPPLRATPTGTRSGAPGYHPQHPSQLGPSHTRTPIRGPPDSLL